MGERHRGTQIVSKMGGGAGRGKKGGPTGRRTFSRVEDMAAGTSSEPRWKARRDREAEDDDEENEEEEDESSGEEEEEEKHKGVSGLIDVQNPNAPKRATVKAANADVNVETQLSRREKEILDKERAKERYMKLQEQGKTEQAQKDLERLALIRKQREEASKKREEERLAKEASKKQARK